MNYHHIFHAGNRCDVVKHALLTMVLRRLCVKERGFCILDTHAGTGLYDLNDPRALKTNEAADGIIALLQAPLLPMIPDYYGVLDIVNPLWDGKTPETFRVYPGSPLFAFHMLRPQDRLIVCELNPDDAEALRLQVPADKRAQIHARDGYEALKAFLPPPEKRGLVLIDPPFEQPGEFDILVEHVSETYKQWPTGIYMIWYPIKDLPAIWAFHDALGQLDIPKILCAEFVYDDAILTDRLCGSGMIIINPPWKFDEEISALFPALHQAMRTAYAGSVVKWISA